MQGLCFRLQYSSASAAVSFFFFFFVSNKNTGSSSESSASLEIILDFLLLLFITDVFLLTCSDHFLGHPILFKCQNFEFLVLELTKLYCCGEELFEDICLSVALSG